MAELSSEVVALTRLDGGVGLITLRDEAHRNTFSPALIDGLVRRFAEAAEDERLRALVLTGYGTYFASGGTKEMLLKMYRGEARFTDLDFFRLPLDCPLPVIAAMQGHGLGGGLIFGLYADLAVLARESVYTANFMKYGFTPGMGATLLAPERLGPVLGREMLLTARNYRGEELARRGCALPVLPRREVLAYARRQAETIADKPRDALIALKRHLNAGLRRELDEVIEQEVRLHDETFGQPDVESRIEALFGR